MKNLNLKSALESCLDESLPLNSVGIRVVKRDVLRLVPRVSHGILMSTYFCYTPLCKLTVTIQVWENVWTYPNAREQ
jgi:hypothetical protein